MSKVRKRSILIQKRIKILSSCQKNTIHPFPNLKCHQNILTDKIIIIISKRTLSIHPPLNTQNFQLWFFLYKSNLWTKYFQNLWNKQKKNTLTGPVNCKKTTRHHAPYHYVQNQGQLMMQSPENGQKPQIGQFFDNFEAKYLEIANFSGK